MIQDMKAQSDSHTLLMIEDRAASVFGLANALVIIGSQYDENCNVSSAVEHIGRTLATSGEEIIHLIETLENRNRH